MNDTTDTVYQQTGGLDVHEADDGLIVFNPETDRVHHLNSTAGVLFALCEEPQTSSELYRSFKSLFDLGDSDDETIRTGLEKLIEDKVLIEADG